jgi:hypothetical protein
LRSRLAFSGLMARALGGGVTGELAEHLAKGKVGVADAGLGIRLAKGYD